MTDSEMWVSADSLIEKHGGMVPLSPDSSWP
jgi:hypothetical protein